MIRRNRILLKHQYLVGMNSKFTYKQILSNKLSRTLMTRSLSISEHHAVLAKKYFALWKVMVQYKKKHKYILEKERVLDEKISTFLLNMKTNSLQLPAKQDLVVNRNLLQENKFHKKKNLCHEIYENRFQAQKEIIQNQKAFIAEQNEIIYELKSNISIPSNITTPKFQECLSTLSKSPSLRKPLPRPPEHPLVKSMKEREEGRKNRWSILAMRRKEKEKFLAEKLQRELEERKQLEIEKRKIEIQKKKENDRIVKEMELKREKEMEICNKLNLKAKYWYEVLLCSKIFLLWKRYMKYQLDLQIRCTHIYEKHLLRKHLISWKLHVTFINEYILSMVAWLEQSYILTITWYHWRVETNVLKRQREEVNAWFDKKIKKNIFNKWLSFAQKSMINKEFIIKSTELFYKRILIVKIFGMWKQLPQMVYFEREKEKRLRIWESRVKAILPDYNMNLI